MTFALGPTGFGPAGGLLPAAIATGGGYLPEARDLFQRLDEQPSIGVKNAGNNLIAGLLDLAVWDDLDILVMPLSADDPQANSRNWRQDAYNLTAVNSPVCADYAWTGDGLTSYLDSGLANNAASGFIQDDAFMGVVVMGGVGDNNYIDVGGGNSYVNALNGSNNAVTRAQFGGGAGSPQSQAFDGAARGFTYWNRKSPTSYVMGKGSAVPVTKTVGTEALNSSTFTLCKSGTSYSARPASGMVVGRGLADNATCLAFSALISAYYLEAFGETL